MLTLRQVWIFAIVLAPLLSARGSDAVFAPAQPARVESVICRDSGLMETLLLKPGMTAKAGDLIAELESDIQKHNYEVSKLRSEDTSALEIAEAEANMKGAEFGSAKERYRKRNVSEFELTRTEAQWQAALAKVKMTKTAMEIAKLEFLRASRELERRRMRSPINGIILEVSKNPGDSLSKGNVVATVGDPKFFKLETSLSAKILGDLNVGDTIPVRQAGDIFVRHATIIALGPLEKSGLRKVSLEREAPTAQTFSNEQYEILTGQIKPPPVESKPIEGN